MSTQKNFRLNNYSIKALKIISEYYDISETEALEDIIRFYVDCKIEDSNSVLGNKFIKNNL